MYVDYLRSTANFKLQFSNILAYLDHKDFKKVSDYNY